jgi:L-ribulose-5-phosphate 4-epimerase
MLEALKEEVCKANLDLVNYGLVIFTWGNVSGIDREKGLIVIKPSGVSYDNLKPEHMVIIDLDGKVVKGNLKPSSDAATHIELYKHFENIGGVVHTHSIYAVAWAQAEKQIPAMGTTHADYFHGPVPCTRRLTKKEVNENYESNTGKLIVETFKKIDPLHIPGVLVYAHGPFSWGKTTEEAVHNAVVLERVAEMAMYTRFINPHISSMDQYLLDKHFLRKHGKDAYYGQK